MFGLTCEEASVRETTSGLRTCRPLAVIIAVAVCLALMGTCACAGNREGDSDQSRGNIDASRQPLTLEQISHLDQKSFGRSLTQLRQITESIPAPEADHNTLTAIQGKLRQTDESTPGYWPTLLRFLQFASSNMALKAPPPGEQAEVLSDILMVGLMRGLRESGKTLLFDEGSFGNGEFTNCRIIFTQNAVQMQNVVFKACAFEFPATDRPNEYLKKVGRKLLSSDLTSVSIPSL
jgi:hypothetical protein